MGPETSALVDAIGSPAFDSRLFKALGRWVAAEHIALYRFDHRGADICCAASKQGGDAALENCRRYSQAGYWRRDPAIVKALALDCITSPVIFRVAAGSIRDVAYRKAMYLQEGIAETVLVCADRPNGRFGLSLMRTAAWGPGFETREMLALADVANVVLSVAAKHAGFGFKQSSRLITSFSSIAEIEAELDHLLSELTLRERQVCARILYGLSVQGIALDLGVGKESVATYRKRAFHRLGIGSRHELLRLYIAAVDPVRGPRDWKDPAPRAAHLALG